MEGLDRVKKELKKWSTTCMVFFYTDQNKSLKVMLVKKTIHWKKQKTIENG